jgi:Carboxypeptidase regulatory-like domain
MSARLRTCGRRDTKRRRVLSISARLLILLFIMTANVFSPTRLPAQAAASIGGTVTDATGAVIPEANVVLKNKDTNIEQSTITRSTGTYAIVDISPGRYSVQVSKDGFRTELEDNIVLGVGQAAALNFSMSAGGGQQYVTVSAEASEIQSSTASLGTVISTEMVNNLPLNGRNFTQLLELTPGVSRISVGQNTSGTDAWNPIGSFTYPAVNGQRNRSNLFYFDGANDLGSYMGTYNYMPIIDDVQEFSVQSHSDLAEFGQATGGIVTIVSRSGGNSLHGSLWEFVRNSDLDARNYFATSINPLHQNQFGGTIGGPVLLPHLYNGKDKTFFFFAYEGFRESQTAQSLLTAPTAAQLGGDFSNLLAKGIVIYNPFSTRPDPANPGEYLRDPFPNNQIPSNLLSPAALLYAKTIFPAPNASGLAGGYNLVSNAPTKQDDGNYSGRLDQALGSHDLLFGRVSTYNQPLTTTVSNPAAFDISTTHGYNIAVHEIHSFGPTSVLETYFGRNIGTNLIHISFPSAPADFPTTLIDNGFSSAYLTGYTGPPQGSVIPMIDVTGYMGSTSNYYQEPNNSDTYEFGGSFSKVWGRNNIKTGAEFATNNIKQPIVTVTETTSSFQTSNLEAPTSATGASTGDALASFLLGVPSAAERRGADEVEHGGWVDGIYAQDQIQAAPNLTVNLGVRWDVSLWPTLGMLSNGQGYVGDMDLNNGTYVISALPPACSATVGAPCIPGGVLPANVVVRSGHNRNLHNQDYSNWQLRLGLAYRPASKTTIMAGYGRFYDEWSGPTQYAQNVAGTWPSVGLLNENTLNQTAPTSTLGDPLNLGNSLVQPAATPFNNATYYYNPNMKTPYSDQWNLEVERGLGASTVASIAYVGSHSSRLDLGGLNNTAEYPAAGTAAQVAARRQYPYIVPTNYDNSSGNSNYNSLQTSLKKATGQGLTYLLSYTWSKSIDLACSGSLGVEGCLLQNPYDPQADRSVSGFDLTNQFSGSVIYEIPFGIGRRYALRNQVVNGLLGGWDVNAIVGMTSGTPYSVTVSGDIANVGNTFVQADRVGNPVPQHRSASEWINPAAFQSPPRYTFGTFGRNALRSDWYRDADVSLFKVFPFFEGAHLEFRAEAFNLTNTPVFSAPTTTVGSPSFGAVASTSNSPRELQFALKLQF